MKNIILVFFSLILGFQSFGADSPEVLRAAQYKELQKQVDDLGNDIHAKKLESIVRLAAEIAEKDPSHYVGEILLPLHEKKGSGLPKAIRKLKPESRKILEQKIRASERETFSGNG